MIIIEIQQGTEGAPAILTDVYADRQAAEQAYHNKLSFAAVSTIRAHSVVMMDSEGIVIKKETYYHE